MKRRFPCGHLGKGQYCHRCAQTTRPPSPPVPKPKRLLTYQGVDLQRFPSEVAKEAIRIIDALASGTPYHQLGGKRMIDLRHLISIPIGYRHRLMVRDDRQRLTPIELLSHETYNKNKPGQR